jgi:hypothetical protein
MNKIAPAVTVFLAIFLTAAACVRKSAGPVGLHPVATVPTAPPPTASDTPAGPHVAPQANSPLAGDPDGASVAQARLVTETCAVGEKKIHDWIVERIEQMRADVDQAFRDWRSLPSCDAAWGAGGLGLSGVGEGGGARGEGIGLADMSIAAQGKSASGTNNQVAGVDEADIVKNDGTYVYLASRGALRIVGGDPPRLRSVTKVPGSVRQMLISGPRAVVFSSGGNAPPDRACTYGYDCSFGGDGSSTIVVVLDVADRDRPRIVRRLDLSGSLIAARRIQDTVHVVVADNDVPPPELPTSPNDLPYCYRDVATVQAEFERLKRDNEPKIRAARPTFPIVTEAGKRRRLCEILRTPLGDGQAFTTVVSFGIRDDRAAPTTVTLQSRPGAVFAAEDSLYVSIGHERGGADAWYGFYEAQKEVTDIHRFRIGAAPGETRYLGSGVVPGHVLNQFSMDEYAGHLRIATTRGRVPDPEADNLVSVLAPTPEGNLVRVGAVDHVAPSEDIRAVRFDGDRGYVVTFKKTDPLFVLDLHEAAAPRILGELKIPGFSTYLHRMDPTHMLSIGFDANDHGSYAYFDGLILQLFDVSRPTEPTLLFKEKIGSRGSGSAAATDHLAFNFFGDRNLLAIPTTICQGGADGTFGDRLTFSGLLVYEVTVKGGFRRIGGVAHGREGASCKAWWSTSTSAVKRSIFMDDLVFSIADDRVKVQRLDKLGEDLADIAIGP